ncbi:MAG: NAD-dependent epimerase/dehydratase family protein [Thomasclavelia sp.]
MKILVTGANGYLGQGVTRELLERGLDVVATDFNDEKIDKRAEIKTADIFNIKDPYKYFGRPDILLHLAWRDGFVHDSVNHINDLPKHYNFINKMINSDIKHVAVLGSMHEIGFYEGSINEHTSCNPQSLYGISKNALRKAVELVCGDKVVFQWLRGFYIVGNSTSGSSIFSKITQAVNEGKKEFPFTLGLNQFDFLDYDEFCKLVVDCQHFFGQFL